MYAEKIRVCGGGGGGGCQLKVTEYCMHYSQKREYFVGMKICGNWTNFWLCLFGFLNNFSVMSGQIFLGSQY